MKTNSDKLLGMKISTVANLDNAYVSTKFRGGLGLKQIGSLDQLHLLEESCPTDALGQIKNKIVDYSKCIMCGLCAEAVPESMIMTNKPVLPVNNKIDLMQNLGEQKRSEKSYEQLGTELKEKIYKLFGRSLAIREIDAGSCNGCEIEITALNNPIYDIERFGIHFVASPRHADILLVTGPASRNMEIALQRTYNSTPSPKAIIAVGACACSGGIFGNTYATTGGIRNVCPVDVYIPGCPPRPQNLIYGIFLAVNKLTMQMKE